MSATLDAEPVRAFLGECPALRSEGRLFELSIENSRTPLRPWKDRWRGLLRVFMGAAMCWCFCRGRRRFAGRRTCWRGHGLLITPLYGDLSPAEQDRAVEPSSKRKVILATNIAESSITIDGVRAVVDSGLARMASDSPWTGLPSIKVQRIAKASAQQRAGRAGRTGPGGVAALHGG